MSAPVIRSFGKLTVGNSSNQETMTVDLPSRRYYDIVFVYAYGFSATAVNGGLPDTPVGFEVLHTSDDTGTYSLWLAGRAFDPEASLTLTAGVGQDVDFWSTQAWVVTNVTPDGTWYDDVDAELITTGGTTPALTVAGADRMVAHFFFLTLEGGWPGNVDHLDGGYSSYDSISAAKSGVYASEQWYTKIVDASEPAQTYTTGAESVDRIFSIAVIGADTSALPAIPQPNRLSLDCATTYTAFITGPDYETRIDRVHWSGIRWERVLDEASTANVVVPDTYGGVRCCVPYGGLVPWAFGLLVERNDVEVWHGPVTTVQRDPNEGTTTIGAADVLSRLALRFAVRDQVVDWKNTDAGVAFADVVNIHSHSSADQYTLVAPKVFTGDPVTRRLLPRKFEMASDITNELAESAVDFFVLNGVLYVWEPTLGWQYIDGYKRTLDGPYNNNADLVYGLFTEAAFSTLPRWGINGMTQANFVVVTGADNGELGAREYFSSSNAESQARYGVLDHVEPNPIQSPSDTAPSTQAGVLQAHANSYLALHALGPMTVEGGVLTQGAPIDVPNLRPGSLWAFDIWDHCYGQLLTMTRLKRVVVEVAVREGALVETISPTMYPPGFEGAENV